MQAETQDLDQHPVANKYADYGSEVQIYQYRK